MDFTFKLRFRSLMKMMKNMREEKNNANTWFLSQNVIELVITLKQSHTQRVNSHSTKAPGDSQLATIPI